MKIPSEAELIEMEKRTVCLPDIIAYLERRADKLDAKVERAEDNDSEVRLTRELRKVEHSIESLRALERDIDILIDLIRQGAWVVQDAR
jgi:hypothetical protein